MQRAKPTSRGRRGSWRQSPTQSRLWSRALRTRRTGRRLQPTASQSCSSSNRSISRSELSTRASFGLAVLQRRCSSPYIPARAAAWELAESEELVMGEILPHGGGGCCRLELLDGSGLVPTPPAGVAAWLVAVRTALAAPGTGAGAPMGLLGSGPAGIWRSAPAPPAPAHPGRLWPLVEPAGPGPGRWPAPGAHRPFPGGQHRPPRRRWPGRPAAGTGAGGRRRRGLSTAGLRPGAPGRSGLPQPAAPLVGRPSCPGGDPQPPGGRAAGGPGPIGLQHQPGRRAPVTCPDGCPRGAESLVGG